MLMQTTPLIEKFATHVRKNGPASETVTIASGDSSVAPFSQ